MITIMVFHEKVAEAKARLAAKVPKASKIEQNPLVTFRYPKSDASWELPVRMVRVISANQKYIWGLEMTDKNRPKKFLRSKMSEFNFRGFNLQAMP